MWGDSTLYLVLAENTTKRSGALSDLSWPGVPSSLTSCPREGWRARLSTTTATSPSGRETAGSCQGGSPGAAQTRGRPSVWRPGPGNSHSQSPLCRDKVNKIVQSLLLIAALSSVRPSVKENQSPGNLNLVHWILWNIYDQAELDHIEMITPGYSPSALAKLMQNYICSLLLNNLE